MTATTTNLVINGERFTDLTGAGLALSGSSLTATLGTDIAAAEIANGDHGFFSYASGVASLDTGGLTSADLLAALTDETGSGHVAFSASPTFTGTVNALAATFSSTLTMSGSAANIVLGSNWLSGDGGDEGIYVDSSGSVGIGTATPAGALQIARGTGASLLIGADTGASTITDSTNKVSRFGMPHYLNAEEPATILHTNSNATENYITFGGGTGSLNAMTSLRFYTAANNTTTTGTERMRIDGAGNMSVGTTTASQKLTVFGTNTQGLFTEGATEFLRAGVGETSNTSVIGWDDSDSLRLGVYDSPTDTTISDLVTILSSGNVGIGTTTPNQKLTVQGNINLSSATGAVYFDDIKYLYASSTNDSVVFGENAGATFTSATSYNVALGFEAGSYASTTSSDYNNFIGYRAGYQNTGRINNILGDDAGYSNTGTSNNIFGENTGFQNVGHYNSLLGFQAGYENTGDYNNIFGWQAGYSNIGNENNLFGTYAGWSSSGDYNNFFGSGAGNTNTGSDNNLFGTSAGDSNEGSFNNMLGYGVGTYNVGDFNNIFGYQAGYVNTGDYNEIFGRETGRFLQSTSTVAIGTQALYGSHATNYISLNNVALGYRAGYASDDGSGSNILIGYQAADNLTIGNNNIIIGYDIDNVTAAADNRLNIGNLIFGTGLDGTGTTLASGNVGIGTTSPLQKLQVRGDIRVGTTGGNGCIEDYGGGVIGGTCSSDERLKESIEPIATEGRSYLESLTALTPVTYNWNETAASLYGKNRSVTNLGLVAQDVEALFPELVSRNEDGFRQVDFRALPFYIIEAMKELWARVQGHDGRLQSLEQELRDMVRENEHLKVRISGIEGELDMEAPPPAMSLPGASLSEPTAHTNRVFIGPIRIDAAPTEPDPSDASADAPAAANDNTAPVDDFPTVESAGA